MEKFTIIKKNSPIYRFIGIISGLILLVFNLISVFYRVQEKSYDFLFYSYLFIALIGLLIFLRFAFLVGDREIFSMDNETILSKISKSGFSINWVDVSRIELNGNALVFFLNAEKKRKQIPLDTISYSDGTKLIELIEAIAQSKNITINTPSPSMNEIDDLEAEETVF